VPYVPYVPMWLIKHPQCALCAYVVNKHIKMKKILIALDFDPTAQKVAEIGFSLSKDSGFEAILLHVITDPVNYSSKGHTKIMGFVGQENIKASLYESKDGLKKASQLFLDKSKSYLGDNTILTLVTEGDLAESILKAANDLKVDIIVMGSHSRKWMENILMGSVVEKVLRNTTIPVLIIPTKKQD